MSDLAEQMLDLRAFAQARAMPLFGDLGDLLAAALDVLRAGRDTPRGTIYLRAGRWRFGAYNTADIPPGVTLMMGEGARIVPLMPAPFQDEVQVGRAPEVDIVRPPSLQIRGPLVAPAGPIFSTLALDEAEFAGPESVGRVALLRADLDVIDPAWWGAGSVSGEHADEVDTTALQAALQAATLRFRWDDDSRIIEPLSPPRVVLTRPIRLTRTIVLDGMPRAAVGRDRRSVTVRPTTQGLVLQGSRRGVADLTPSPNRASGFERLILLQQPAGLLLDALRLDSEELDACVGCEATAPERPLEVELRDCVFEGRGARLVEVTMTTTVGLVRTQPHALLFDGCAWRPGDVSSAGMHALSVSFPEGRVVVRDGHFAGDAARMVSLWAGALRLDHCRFDNTRTPGASADAAQPQPGGVDVEIMPTLRAPAQLTLLGCCSSSWQVLASAPSSTAGTAASRAATVTALFHQHGSARAEVLDPPTMLWRGASMPRARLTLVGGRIVPPANAAARFAGRVLLGTGSDGVYDAWLGPTGPRYVDARGAPSALRTISPTPTG